VELRGSTFHPPTLDCWTVRIVPRMIDVGLKAPNWQFRDRETAQSQLSTSPCWRAIPNHPYRVQCEQWKLMQFLEESCASCREATSATVTRSRRCGSTDSATVTRTRHPVRSCGPLRHRGGRRRSAVRRSLGVNSTALPIPSCS